MIVGLVVVLVMVLLTCIAEMMMTMCEHAAPHMCPPATPHMCPPQAKAARADESPLLSEASSSDSERGGEQDDEKRDRTVKPRLRNPVVPPKPRRKPDAEQVVVKEGEEAVAS